MGDDRTLIHDGCGKAVKKDTLQTSKGDLDVPVCPEHGVITIDELDLEQKEETQDG